MTENRRRFFCNGFLLTLVALVMRTVALFFGAYVTRAVGAVGMGLYTLVSTVYGFAVTLATSGVSLTVTRLVASSIGREDGRGVSRVLRGAFLYSAAFGTLATAGLFLLSDLLAVRLMGVADLAVSMKILSISLIPVAMSAVVAGYFVGVRRVGFNAAVQVASQILKIPLTVWLVEEFRTHGDASSVAALCLALTVTETVSFLIILLELALDRARHRVKGGGMEFGSVAKTALPLGASAYVRSALITLEHSIIPKRLSAGGEGREESFAAYGALHGMALPLILYPMAAISSFAGLLVPEFAECSSRSDRGRANRIGAEAINTTLKFATVCATFLFVFAEELGYTVYDSYSAGYYIAMLAPVVPIMYLDHVTDAMLKGVGEQVYSMWVNITDSFISIILVWTLIPRLGILGYAIAIIGMEAYNFTLSAIRLSRHVAVRPDLFGSVLIPLVLSLASGSIALSLFSMNGQVTTPKWLALKMLFALCILIASHTVVKILFSRSKKVAKKC